MYYSIPLARNLVALVDEEDYPLVSQYKWWLSYPHIQGLFYARTVTYLNGKRREIALHRLIMGFPEGKEIDHINGDGLDNRRSNLRICNRAENMHNSRKQKNNKSGYKGVILTRSGNWRASIGVNGKCISLGTFYSAIDAAKRYDEEAKKLYGEFAALNFSDEKSVAS